MRQPKTGLRRNLSAIIAATAASALVAGCGSSSTGSSEPKDRGPYHVAFVSGLTGLLQSSAVAVRRGVQASVDELNDSGGINGRKIKLVSKDDQSDPTKAATLVQGLVSGNSKPDLVIAGISTNESLAMAPLLTRQKVISIGMSSSAMLNAPKKYPYSFQSAALQADVVAGAAAFFKNEGAKKVAVVVPNDGLGTAEVAAFKDAMDKIGVRYSVALYPPDSIDISPSYQKALSSNPDWIFTDGAGSQVGNVLVGRLKASAEKVNTLVGSAMSAQPLLKVGTPAQLKNLHVSLMPTQTYVDPAHRSPLFKEFFTRVMAQGPLESTLYTYAAGFDIVQLWARAAKKAGPNATSDQVKAAMESLPPSNDSQFPLYRHTWTPSSHSPSAKPEEFHFAEVVGTKDGMSVTK